ncbi:MAG: hypothetical protein IPJ65_27990 [Archangiaceae bacterium]|nr:hypothetical protein [Archangiaceae bacterium]
MGSAITRAMPSTLGLPLNELLAGYLGRIPVEVALGVMRDVARLLERSHQNHHLHGSLCPHAIWVSSSAEVWLEWHPPKSPTSRSLPPEVRQGQAPSVASDVYALAAVGYELLTGLSVSRAWAKAPLVNLQDVASARQFNGLVPVDVDEVLSLGLKRLPHERPQRVEVLARVAEGVIVPGRWELELAGMVGDSFFAPALRELPVTCERAGPAVPRPLPATPPAPTTRLVIAEPLPRLELEVLQRESANEDCEPRAGFSRLKAFGTSAVVTALTLALACSFFQREAPVMGVASAAAVALATAAPVDVPALPELAEPPPSPAPSVKAERPRANKRGGVSHRKRHPTRVP